ncbi:MAG TPA: VOC family protein [Woeseiaceae bacterium]|jgi:PhnB protein|nr:VOC family protein [Woeseiaceae bacterium]
MIKAIPAGYEAVSPYLVVKGAARAIDFYKTVLGATELMRYDDNGRVGHAELRIGGGIVMLADEYPERGITGPKAGEPPAVGLMLYVEDVDAVVARAEAAGATVERPVADQFYGDRAGVVVDPFGHRWFIQTHVEDVPPEELAERAGAAET